ncbi:hypothetical protein HDU84_001449 [Entophlyctis sp. JEL0112]|nr:hypothetical protein HDU84_001449 [Entophlyctis sp. JEL0112]
MIEAIELAPAVQPSSAAPGSLVGHRFVVETGGGPESTHSSPDLGPAGNLIVSGVVRFILGGFGGGVQVPDATVKVSVIGTAVTSPDAPPKRVLSVAQTVYNSVADGPLILKRSTELKFAVDLKSALLPPSFALPDGLVSIQYSISAECAFMQDGAKVVRECSAPLVIVADSALRALVLAVQSPVSLANGDDGYMTESVNYIVTLARRSVLAGDNFLAEVNVGFLAGSNQKAERVSLSLCSRLVMHSPDGDVSKDLGTLSSVTESLADPSFNALSLSDTESETTKFLKLPVPATLPSSIETSLFSHQYVVRLEIFVMGKQIPAVVVDFPVVVIDADTTIGIVTPQLMRSTSIGPDTPSREAMEQNFVGNFVALRNFSHDGGDDLLSFSAGDAIIVKEIFSDGFAYCKHKSSGESGYVQMHYLMEESFVTGCKLFASSETVTTTSRVPDLDSPEQSVIRTLPSTSPASTLARSVNDRNSLTSSDGKSNSMKIFGWQKKAASSVISLKPVVPVTVDSVVDVETAIAHLGLLHRFSVLEMKENQLADWSYLCHAEQRYLMWLDLLRETRPLPDELPLPPLDVALVWHTHMLNPLRYLEDCYFIFGDASVYYMPFKRMHDVPGPKYDPADGSQEVWSSFTGEPFHIPVGDMSPFNFRCPWCGNTFVVEADLFVTFRMKDVAIPCSCGHHCSAENISAKRFLSDIERFRLERRLLLGTVLDENTGEINTSKAHQDLVVLFSDGLPAGASIASQSSYCTWLTVEKELSEHVKKLRAGKSLSSKLRKSSIAKMIRSYQNIPIPLSIDLVAAVIRQRGFTGKMVGGIVDWGERDALPRATIRYRNFLGLMKKEPRVFLVPTLDVDLMWHTHQCHPANYQAYGLREMKRIINHDDNVEAAILTTSFDQTAKLWKKAYKERYSFQMEEAKWFRRPATLAYPAYMQTAAANAVTVTRPTGVPLDQAGGCGIHNPTPPPVANRRSLAAYPIGAPVAVGTGAGAAGASRARPAVLVGSCYSCGVACGGWGYYGSRFHPWGYWPYYYSSPLIVWGGCGAFSTCGYYGKNCF